MELYCNLDAAVPGHFAIYDTKIEREMKLFYPTGFLMKKKCSKLRPHSSHFDDIHLT